MAPRPHGPYLDRLCVALCRLAYARQRIRELERLLAEAGVALPESLTEVPGVKHWCFPGERAA